MFSTSLIGQSFENLPKLEAAYQNHFYQENASYASKCFDDALFDQQGRLWLRVCSNPLIVNAVGLMRFDGYQFTPYDLKIDVPQSNIAVIRLAGVDRSGKIFGTAGTIELTSHLFFADPLTGASDLFELDQSRQLSIKNIIETEDDHFLLLFGGPEKDSIGLLSLQDGRLTKERVIPARPGRWRAAFGVPVIDTPNDIWCMALRPPIFRFDKIAHRQLSYEADQFIDNQIKSPLPPRIFPPIPTMVESALHEIFVHMPEYQGDHIYRFDPAADHFVSMMDQFPEDWKPKGIFQDQKGNICFLFQDTTENYRAVLQDTLGRFFDYSSLVRDQPKINKLISENFFQQVFLAGINGLYLKSIRQTQAIKTLLPGKMVNSMVELSNGQILLNTTYNHWFILDPETDRTIPFKEPECEFDPSIFGPEIKQQIYKDKNGHLWFLSNGYLVRYQPLEQICTTFPLDDKYRIFQFVNERLVVLANGTGKLGFYDPVQRSFLSFGRQIPAMISNKIRDFHIDKQGMLWMPSNRGLWKLDLEKEESELIGLNGKFNDTRFTAIYEAPDGKIWLGSYFDGLHIFDPVTGVVRVINQEQGLSNNAVMSIIADDQQFIWVTTEYGITLLSSDGQVLREIHREDGLNNEVFERFDSFKDSRGRLYFGSRNGLIIIDPEQFRANLGGNEKVEIYLTKLAYYDQEIKENVVKSTGLNLPQQLTFPADQRYLRLSFALTSYLESHRNRYAYLLEGIQDDWISLGTQRELTLTQLPAGKYRLLIKGADYQNNWTQEPVAIQIHARDFFYKQVWFQALIVFALTFISFFWIQRLRSEKTRLEAEVHKRTHQIREDKALIEQQADELKQLDELKSRFFSNISHELRTPITLITAPLEQLMKEQGKKLNQLGQNSLQLVLKNARNLIGLVEELLDLSKLEADKLELHEQATALVPFCRQIFGAFESKATHEQIRYTFSTDLPESAHFLLDRKALKKILDNLLSNALKFTPRDGQVSMDLQWTGEQLQIQVSDTGRGIPPEDLPHIFDRYFQTKNREIPREGGTGIGLALANELTRLMQGQIRVESEWTKGSTFFLQFPAKETAPENAGASGTGSEFSKEAIMPLTDTVKMSNQQNENRQQTTSSGHPTGPDESAPHILIVEDNPDIQQMLHDLLANQYHCKIANDGREALDLLNRAPWTVDRAPSLIISDIMMPRLDGHQLLEQLKAHPEWRQIPVIMLTALAREESKLRALRTGVDDYLIKPFSPAELLARVANLLHNYQLRRAFQQQLMAEAAPEEKGTPEFQFEAVTSADQLWLEELENAAKAALDKQLDLNRIYLAETLAMSDRNLLRRIKSLTGLTIQQYILEAKLQKARHLLEHKAFGTVAEVAYACGFNAPNYFSRQYEKRFGKRPAEY